MIRTKRDIKLRKEPEA